MAFTVAKTENKQEVRINSYLFLALTTVEPLVYVQFYLQKNLLFLFSIIVEPIFNSPCQMQL
jgi:hypothetical protein